MKPTSFRQFDLLLPIGTFFPFAGFWVPIPLTLTNPKKDADPLILFFPMATATGHLSLMTRCSRGFRSLWETTPLPPGGVFSRFSFLVSEEMNTDPLQELDYFPLTCLLESCPDPSPWPVGISTPGSQDLGGAVVLLGGGGARRWMTCAEEEGNQNQWDGGDRSLFLGGPS